MIEKPGRSKVILAKLKLGHWVKGGMLKINVVFSFGQQRSPIFKGD